MLSALCQRALRTLAPNLSDKNEKTGADIPAEVGVYVMPNPGCARQVEEDAKGMAGRITKIIREDGSVESEQTVQAATNDAQKCQNEGLEGCSRTGNVILFVEWAADGIEKGELTCCSAAAAIIAKLS